MLLSLASVRPDAECTPFATICRYWPKPAASPSCFGGSLAAGAAGWPSISNGVADATFCSGGIGRGSGFWMLHHEGHRGGWPPVPRVHFEYPNGSPILNAKYARRK